MKALAVLLFLVVPVYGQERGSDEHVREVMQQALDDAFQDQIRALFLSWMKDDKDQPRRASVGIRKSVAAYRHAMQAIANEKLTWKTRRLAKR